MAKIVDPDQLNVGTELTLDTAAKTFTLNVAGNLVAKDGVSWQALYSKFIELWTTSAYNKYQFPAYVIGDPRAGMFVCGFDGASYTGWKPADNATRTYLRDGGWAEYTAAGALTRQHVGIVSQGDVSASAQLYYQRAAAGAPANFTFTDEVNEGIQVFGDATNGNFDERTFFKAFCREYSKTYSSANLALVGETGTGPFKIGLPLANADDLKVAANDATVAANAPYTQIKARFFNGTFSIDVDTPGTARNFGVVVDVGTHSGIDGSATNGGASLATAEGGVPVDGTYDGGTVTIHEGTCKGTYTIGTVVSATAVPITTTFPATEANLSFTLQRATPVVATNAQIYTKVQYLLRQSGNINSVAGSVTGKTTDVLLTFAGDQLEAGRYFTDNPNGSVQGVYVAGFQADDATLIDFYDSGGTKRNYAFNATGTLNFNSFLTAGGTGYYRMYFSTLPGGSDDYDQSGAVTVDDADGADIAGVISGASIPWDFAYDTNVQGGRTAATDASVTVVAGNPGSAKPAKTVYTITRTLGQPITLTAEQDRGYLNP